MIGSGASGLPAAIVAREAGSSVIVVEAQPHIGGHGICSGGNVPLGGGTSAQKKYGIEDSPDLVFRDLTDWSVVEPNGFPDYRYNDREIIRAFADNCAATYEFLIAHGVVFVDKAPDTSVAFRSATRCRAKCMRRAMDWPLVQTGKPADAGHARHDVHRQRSDASARGRGGKAGCRDSAVHRMTAIHREAPHAGPALGIAADNNGTPVNIRARKAVIIGPAVSTGNVNFRRMFDPRLTEEYCGVAGHAVVGSGRQRRTRRHGDRRIAVGPFQPYRRIRLGHHQAGHRSADSTAM